jgi:recombination protein RecA
VDAAPATKAVGNATHKLIQTGHLTHSYACVVAEFSDALGAQHLPIPVFPALISTNPFMEVIMSKKQSEEALDHAIDRITRKHGAGTVMRMGERPRATQNGISTGSLALDHATGCGGYPRGRIVEIYGPESSGKTTLTLHAIACCQADGGVAAFIDAEHALDPTYAQNLGIDLDSLLISQPDHGEQALDVALELVSSGAVDLVVIDSVAALVPKAELNGEMGDLPVGLQARLMSQALRKLTGIANRNQTTIIFINQLRQKIGVTFGSNETTTGGNALKFYASMRIDVRRIGSIKSDGETVANKTRVRVVKNKMAPPFKIVEFEIRYGVGIDNAAELLSLAETNGIVTRSGSWFALGDRRLGQGRENALAALMSDEAAKAAVSNSVRDALQPKMLNTQ